MFIDMLVEKKNISVACLSSIWHSLEPTRLLYERWIWNQGKILVYQSKFPPTLCTANKKGKEKVENLKVLELPVSLTQVHRLPERKDTKQMNKQTKILLGDRASQLARKKCQSNSVLVPSGYFSSLRWLPAIFLTRILEEPDTGHIQNNPHRFYTGPSGCWNRFLGVSVI